MSWISLIDHHLLPTEPGIYAIRHKASGKEYVGQSTNIRRRAKSHAWASPKHYLGRAIRAHGPESFQIRVLQLCVVEQLGDQEQKFIAERKTRYPAGYNLSDGGMGPTGVEWSEERRAAQSARVAGVPLAPETKAKMREAALRSNPFKGKTHTAEAKAKMAAATIAFHTGRKRSDEMRAKMSAIKKGIAPVISAEARARGAEKRRGRPAPASSQPGTKNGMYGVRGASHPLAKAVAVWEPESMTPKIFGSGTEAAAALGTSPMRVSDFLKERRKDPKGRAYAYL